MLRGFRHYLCNAGRQCASPHLTEASAEVLVGEYLVDRPERNRLLVEEEDFVKNLRDAGDPVELAKQYCREGADELVFLDITATADNRDTVYDLVSRVADVVNIPFAIGGGVRSLEDAQALLEAGADKIAINSAAVKNPQLLSDISDALGSANTVCAIDAKRRKKHGETMETITVL